MIYAFVFLLLDIYLVAVAAFVGGFAWVLLWPSASVLLFATAYALSNPRLLGKRSDGRLAWWSWPALGPILGLLEVIWHLHRSSSRDSACHEITAGLWLGRRPLQGEIPPSVRLVVDLTAEFAEAREAVGDRAYLCLPTLDGLAPALDELEDVLADIMACDGAVYIHCAMGHGRSAMVAAAVLLRRGIVGNVADAERWIRDRRPGVRLKPVQRRLLHQMVGR